MATPGVLLDAALAALGEQIAALPTQAQIAASGSTNRAARISSANGGIAITQAQAAAAAAFLLQDANPLL